MTNFLILMIIFILIYILIKGMLDRRPNLNDVNNTDIFISELKMKWQG